MRRLLGFAAALLPTASAAAKPPAQLFLSYYSGVSPSVRLRRPRPFAASGSANALARAATSRDLERRIGTSERL